MNQLKYNSLSRLLYRVIILASSWTLHSWILLKYLLQPYWVVTQFIHDKKTSREIRKYSHTQAQYSTPIYTPEVFKMLPAWLSSLDNSTRYHWCIHIRNMFLWVINQRNARERRGEKNICISSSLTAEFFKFR